MLTGEGLCELLEMFTPAFLMNVSLVVNGLTCQGYGRGGGQLSLFWELVSGCPRWSSVGYSPASVVIETETPVPHYPDRTHSPHRL